MQTMLSTAGAAFAQPGPVPASSLESDGLAPGAKAGPWIVERELGRGGMGAVYAVTHEDIGKRAALKVMHRRLLSGSSAERILLEARVVNQVGHPNIVDIFETGTLDDGRPYIVMERLEGMPLSFRADEGKILPDQVIGILLQVCDALIAAHAANVVHRDLKLDNIFLIDNADDPSQPKVKLLDWGIAKVISANARHTIEGQLVGTPQYLSPEQARGAAVSPQTDVYSLGVMAYELFLEQLPFEAETSAEIMAMHLRATPPPPSELWPDIPASLEDLLLAMLAKDPEARPTMLTVAHTLELVRDDLDQRRHESTASDAAPARAVTVAPIVRRSSNRWAVPTSAGLAPTEPAAAEAWPTTNRRWHVAIGAFALAASTLMFVFTRNTDPAAAAPTQRSAVIDEALTPEALRAPRDNIAAIADTHEEGARIPAALDEPESVDLSIYSIAAPVAPAAASITPIVHKPVKRSTPAARSARRVQVTPRLDHVIDPDGTLDPYR
jgi:tRNA A-37 threonylcarbamoyl transferase component Bud32